MNLPVSYNSIWSNKDYVRLLTAQVTSLVAAENYEEDGIACLGKCKT